jgi:hypothetical protein
MSKRCKLQKEFFKLHGNYKGTGTYNDNYVKWLEDKVIEQDKTINEIENAMERWHHARDNDNETIDNINEIMVSIGKLEWFNKKPSK